MTKLAFGNIKTKIVQKCAVQLTRSLEQWRSIVEYRVVLLVLNYPSCLATTGCRATTFTGAVGHEPDLNDEGRRPRFAAAIHKVNVRLGEEIALSRVWRGAPKR